MRTKRKNYLPQCPPYPPGPPYQPYWQYPPCQESAAIPKALQSLPIPNRVAGTLFKQAQMMPKEHFPSLFGNMKGMAFGDWSVGSAQLQHRFTFASLMLFHNFFFQQDSLRPYGYDYLHSSMGQPQVHFPIKFHVFLLIFSAGGHSEGSPSAGGPSAANSQGFLLKKVEYPSKISLE